MRKEGKSVAELKQELDGRLPKAIEGWEPCPYHFATHYLVRFLLFPVSGSTEFADRYWSFLHQKQASTEERSAALKKEKALAAVESTIKRYWIKENGTGKVKLETLDRVLCDMGIAAGTYSLDPRGWIARPARGKREREVKNSPIPGGLTDRQLIAYLILAWPPQSNRKREKDLRARRILSSFVRVREQEAMTNLRREMARDFDQFR